jgi:hypothetical protein
VLDYLHNRRTRERQVLQALEGRRFGLTPYGIVRAVYPQLSLTLTFAAASNVEKTLIKLQKDGVAEAQQLSPCPIRIFGFGVDYVFLKRWYLRQK